MRPAAGSRTKASDGSEEWARALKGPIVLHVAKEYFSDRERGPRPRTAETLDSPAWGGIVAVLEGGAARGLFAEDFPRLCEDQPVAIGTDDDSLARALRAEVPALGGWPSLHQTPDTLDALDLIEFMFRHASEPRARSHHGYFGHDHLGFDRDAGRAELHEDVNRIFARCGLAYELGQTGEIRRLGPPVVAERARVPLPGTSDDVFDKLVTTSLRKFFDPDLAVRREALESLWDAFERAKTILDSDKKKGAAQLADRIAASPAETQAVQDEMRALTEIGNDFRIRHHETKTIEPSSAFVDYLFARAFAFVHAAAYAISTSV